MNLAHLSFFFVDQFPYTTHSRILVLSLLMGRVSQVLKHPKPLKLNRLGKKGGDAHE